MADQVLQAGLAAGMSATSGIHSPNPIRSVPNVVEGAHSLPIELIPTTASRLTLRGAAGDVYIPYMCIGAWPWGDAATWHYTADELPNIKMAWEKLRQAGIIWIDTAQAYGDGESEKICGDLCSGLQRDEFIIQTKWTCFPNTTNLVEQSKAPPSMLKRSLERLRLEYVDIYLVHGPIHPSSLATVAKGLAECVNRGMTRAVGVANYNIENMVKMADELAKHNIPLATNQCEYSVLRRYPETHGVIRACRERGIIFQSYSSLGQGRLTGKYGPGHEPPGTYRFSKYPMTDLEPTLTVLSRIAKDRGTTMSAVALNFNISKGAVPVVGMRNPDQAEQNLRAFGWRLTAREIREIEAVSLEGKTTRIWQQA
jgi:aryl-alcohol dehydrogenase-like predicted oxidoreductase